MAHRLGKAWLSLPDDLGPALSLRCTLMDWESSTVGSKVWRRAVMKPEGSMAAIVAAKQRTHTYEL